MPGKYEDLGISFQYPDNWTLDEEDIAEGRQSVTVYSPDGAFWSVAVHPVAADPGQLIEAAVNAMKEEYEGIEVEDSREVLEGHELTGCKLNFFFLDLTSTAKIRCLKTPLAVYSIFCQGEDREFERIGRVFQAMTRSLLGGLRQAEPGDA